MDGINKNELAGKIYEERPDIILNIDNEFLTLRFMDMLTQYYNDRGVTIPQRHYFNRFRRDFR